MIKTVGRGHKGPYNGPSNDNYISNYTKRLGCQRGGGAPPPLGMQLLVEPLLNISWIACAKEIPVFWKDVTRLTDKNLTDERTDKLRTGGRKHLLFFVKTCCIVFLNDIACQKEWEHGKWNLKLWQTNRQTDEGSLESFTSKKARIACLHLKYRVLH